ncbi:uncharacterized protein DUF4421 [Larkinella arboricola]|uniref:Uncharacterized protein DUF4421 n=1 Tax=Larkinella arboricola TaxID=643671 RepID=A0A327WZP4_LARAB|nr:DUF4421 domain-containing protein [Larkinella arboricola]RAJ98196.1 uncharacterized protein DUF4421 [Larkinella arboricola]
MKQSSTVGHALADFCEPAFSVFRPSLSTILLLLTALTSPAQNRFRSEVDSAYVQTFRGKLTGRAYLSQKYTSFNLSTPTAETPALRFLPNAPLNLGIGATFNALTLNLAYGLSFLNKNNGKGETSNIDLQTHVYTRKWVLDGVAQFYNGYFLTPRGRAAASPELYYHRPDLRVRLVGGAIRRVFNFRRFSFRASFVQNEWQKQSAGTWLTGFQFYYGIVQGDSALVPEQVQPNFPDEDVRRMRFLKLGPSAGYAYTFVYRQNWFATASLMGNLNATFSKERFENRDQTRSNVRPDLLFQVVGGYNSNRWCVTLGWINGSVTVRNPLYHYTVHTGNYRFTVARRFIANSRLRKLVPETIKVL